MVEIFKIIGLALITTISVIILKQHKPEIAVIVGVAGSILIFFFLVDMLGSVLGLFETIVSKTNIDRDLFVVLIKIIGIGYLTEFSANICADSGNSAVASKILLAGKLVIFVLSIPVIMSLIELIVGLMQ
ncbi:MAG: stage III sporulation protein AD [Clostridia bacterium]|nr:stage III sporulation protein AD [Clostridia bacterium]